MIKFKDKAASQQDLEYADYIPSKGVRPLYTRKKKKKKRVSWVWH